MIETNGISSFPDQVVPDEIKDSWDYGNQVGRAIEGEWFGYNRVGSRYHTNFQNYHQLRLYARGEQSIQKYKDELSINGDLSYLNLDWKPVPVIPKFVDIVVNGMSDKQYDIKAYAQDPESLKRRTEYAEAIFRDMQAQAFLQQIQEMTGQSFYSSQDPENLPANREELDLHMQLSYKQSVEIAEEEAINTTLDRNRWELTKRRLNYDLTVLGIACVKTSWNRSEGVRTEYVDPASIVYSYTEDPNFEDVWYVGEVKGLTLPEVKKEFPHLTDSELEELQKYQGNNNYLGNNSGRADQNTIQLLYFEYKTYNNQVFKIKQTPTGLEKALEKPDTFNPPTNDNFDRVSRSIEVLYSGVKVLSHNKLLKWELCHNMVRPKSNLVKVNMNYTICAPRMYRGRIESIVSRITGFADMIQLTHLKMQQILSRMVPDGVYLDADGLAEVDLGNGTNYNPAEALNMYFQTGSIIGRSLTQDGDINRGKVPIQELQTSSAGAKLQSLIQTYQYYLQMIRDVTGLNEARDGSTPDPNSLVGLQKLAAANSNTATRHILQASLYLAARTCENIALRISDSLEFPLTKEALEASISSFNVGTLEDVRNLHLYDFGIFLELVPDEEESAQLEQNIQIALQQQSINLEDAIEIRQINNLKLANQMLKLKRKEKQAYDEQVAQQNIAAQAKANQETAEAAALAETQKHQVLTEQDIQLEQAKNQFEIGKLREEAELKKQLMEQEFQYNMQLAKAKLSREKEKEQFIEDRKDQRTKIEGTQQSQMIDQRKNNLLPMDFETPTPEAPDSFESMGNDSLGGFGMDQFVPQ